jgi:hypothetical protein
VREGHEGHDDRLREGPTDGRCETRGAALARVAAQQHLEQLGPQPLLLAGALRLLLGISLRAGRRDLVDVGEDRLTEREQDVRGHLREVDEPRDRPEGDAGAVAVGGEQRLEAPPRPHLAPPQALVDPLAVGRQRLEAGTGQVEEAVQGDRDPLSHALPEPALHGHRIDRHVSGYAIDDRLDDVADDGAQCCADFGRKIQPRWV